MRAIRLAVFFDQQIHVGGGYQQALNAALLTREIPSELAQVTFYTTLEENLAALASYGIEAQLIQLSTLEKLRAYVRRGVADPRFLGLLKKFERYAPFEKYLVKNQIDLVYFLSPSGWARSLEEINYITTVWDLCHRDDPEFPEVRWNRELELRDKNFRALLPRAVAVFVDSELGRSNVERRYGIDKSRIHVVPFQAAVATRSDLDSGSAGYEMTNVHEKHQLNVPYVFYPAQFWAHKNHVYLLEGLKILEQRYGLKIGAIFSGSEQGNYQYVKRYVQRLGLEDRVRFIGFASNEEMPELYRQSIALVMPSYFGPTNLPPLEAFELGVPVIYSDKLGLREQVGNAALLMDLKDPGSMAAHIRNLLQDDELRQRLVEAGRLRLKHFDASNREEVLLSVLEEFRWKRLCW